MGILGINTHGINIIVLEYPIHGGLSPLDQRQKSFIHSDSLEKTDVSCLPSGNLT